MKRQFRTHEEIDEYYRKRGLDVDSLNREFEENLSSLREAIRRVKKRKFLGGIFYKPYGPGLGNLKIEVQREWDSKSLGGKK